MSTTVLPQICRACLESEEKMYPLIGSIVNVDVDIATMLSFCISDKIDLSKNLPDTVCLTCFKIIRIAYNFLLQFRESQKILLGELECENKAEIEPFETNNCGVSVGCVENRAEMVVEKEEPTNDVNEADHNSYTNEVNVSYDVDLIHNYADTSNVFLNGTNVQEEPLPLQFEEAEIKYDVDNDIEFKTEINIDENTNGAHTDAEVNNDSELCDALKDILPDPSDSNIDNFIIVNETRMIPTSDKTLIEGKERNRSRVSYYVCPLCNSKFSRISRFSDHILAHNEKKIMCDKCAIPTEFHRLEYMDHYKAVHRFYCDICNKTLTSNYGYRLHMKQHQQANRHKCPIDNCKKSYILPRLLKNHMQKHSETVYMCDLCSATFKTYDTFRYHQKTHDGKRNHLCTYCGKAFFQAVHLRDHVFRHIGLKRFKCEHCSTPFTTNSQLKKHTNRCKRLQLKVK